MKGRVGDWVPGGEPLSYTKSYCTRGMVAPARSPCPMIGHSRAGCNAPLAPARTMGASRLGDVWLRPVFQMMQRGFGF